MEQRALQDTGRGEELRSRFLDFGSTLEYPSRFLTLCSLRGENAGGVAQLGERLNGIQEVRGSIPLTSIPEPDASIMAGLAKKGPASLSVLCRFGGTLMVVRLRQL